MNYYSAVKPSTDPERSLKSRCYEQMHPLNNVIRRRGLAALREPCSVGAFLSSQAPTHPIMHFSSRLTEHKSQHGQQVMLEQHTATH